MHSSMEFVYLVVGLVVGAVAVYFVLKSKVDGYASTQQELTDIKGQLPTLQQAKASLEADNRNLSESVITTKVELEAARVEVGRLTAEHSSLKADYKNLDARLNENKGEMEQMQEKFKVEFKNIANELLEDKSKRFTEQNKQNIGEILKPLNEKIKDFENKVESTHKESLVKNAAMQEQIIQLKDLNTQMAKEAINLTNALKGDNKAQGGYGEMQLERILELAGLQRDVHYSREENFKTEDGSNQRLDFVLKLPEDKCIVLDSKVSLTAYSDYYNAEEEVSRQDALKRHLLSVHNHIKLLGSKDYQKLGIRQPDYVLLFMANEPALTLALKEDPSLFEKALERNIVVVSTSTLLATLRTVAYIWRQDNQNNNAVEIARQAGNLYDKFEGLVADLLMIGKRMDEGKKVYEGAMKKLSTGPGNLVRRVENLKKLGAKAAKSLPGPLLERAEDGADEKEQVEQALPPEQQRVKLFE